jgi:Domain of unknown function (DUF4062)
MARLRVFISSTCYDLDIIRGELRPFISSMGFEPVMSDYSDVLYDPRSHTHDSCIKELPGCDIVVLIIGSRFGGTAVPSALQLLDLEAIGQLSTTPATLENTEKFSITQLEVLKAVEASIPVYAFVDERVLHDHLVYEKNKDNKDVIDKLVFPSIQKKETAKYIFEFINFLSHRITNNSVLSFGRLEDIRSQLASQWSQLFQRLLIESRTQTQEARRYRDFSERIDDLKAVVLASLATPGLRDTAKGAVQFRHLIGFISSFVRSNTRDVLLSSATWDELLLEAGIVEVSLFEDTRSDRLMRPEVFLIRGDRTFYRFRLSPRAFEDFTNEWQAFQRVDHNVREAIIDAILEEREWRPFAPIRYYKEKIDEYLLARTGIQQIGSIEQDPHVV